MNLRINRLYPSRAEGAYLLCRAATLACALIPVPCFLSPASATALAQTPLGPGFSFQGRLFDGSLPASGVHQMMFRLYDAEEFGNQIGSSFEDSVTVDADGLFTVEVDSSSFGPLAFDGHERWLEIIIDDTTTLLPRQKLTAAPYAHQAKAAFALVAADGSPTNSVVVDNNGNVGIYNTGPEELLHVGNGTAGETIQIGAYSAIGEETSSGATIVGDNAKPANSPVAGMVYMQTHPSYGARAVRMQFLEGITFHASSGSVSGGDPFASEAMRITNSGNVGINNTAPETLLHILNGSDATGSGGGYIQMGPSGDENIALDNNEIQARYNGAPATLALNFSGGDVDMCPNGGNVGIGTTAPAAKAHIATVDLATPPAVMATDVLAVEGNDGVIGVNSPGGAGYGSGIALREVEGGALVDTWSIVRRNNAASNPSLRFQYGTNAGPGANSTLMSLTPTGDLGIGTFPQFKLDVAGSIRATGSVFASCGTLTCSDQRYKTEVAPLEGALETIEKLRPVRFNWRRHEFPDHQFSPDRQVGLIAQEVQQVLPEVVQKGGDGFYSVDYGKLTPVLVEAVKEVKCEKDLQIAEQQQAISELRTENAELKARLERLETMVASMAARAQGIAQ